MAGQHLGDLALNLHVQNGDGLAPGEGTPPFSIARRVPAARDVGDGQRPSATATVDPQGGRARRARLGRHGRAGEPQGLYRTPVQFESIFFNASAGSRIFR
jgi:hypothetical protein